MKMKMKMMKNYQKIKNLKISLIIKIYLYLFKYKYKNKMLKLVKKDIEYIKSKNVNRIVTDDDINLYDVIILFTPLSWEKIFFKNKSKLLHICNMLRDKEYYPPTKDVFNIFHLLAPKDIKVVILGQDPYYNYDMAMGLSFSVRKGKPIPKSLKNIYKNLCEKVEEFLPPKHGSLLGWAEQGVFLYNTALTVFPQKPGSHTGIWKGFSTDVIKYISKRGGIVFMLWGRKAQNFEKCIVSKDNLILKTSHPSGLSANRGFLTCDHFVDANKFLKEKGREPIDWCKL